MVLTKAKDLSKYVFTITSNAPKRFRFTIVNRMINLSFDALENLVCANELLLGQDTDETKRRRQFQHTALAKLRVLDALAMTAREQNCILPKQYEVLSGYISDCINLTGAWMNSDKRRLTSMGIRL